MQQAPTQRARFPIGRAIVVVTAWATGLFAVELWAVPAMFGAGAGGRGAVCLMTPTVWLSGLLSLYPVWRVGVRSPMATVAAFLKGAGVRIVVCLIVMVIAIKALGLPPGPVVVALMGTYLPILFAETALVRRFLRQTDHSTEPNSKEALA